MAVISNLNSRQNPMAAVGRTGTQIVKLIDCPRVYIKTADSITTPVPVAVKSNGTVPSGWTDLGIVNGKVKITYTKEQKEVRTGLDQVLRAVYIGKKTAGFEFPLSQFDDVAVEQLSGLTPSLITNASIYQFGLGSEDVIQRALLLVVQNKLDGKEWQFYTPSCYMTFQIEDAGEETLIKGTGMLPAFTYASADTYFVASIFA